jgi:predicted tellurium resistance membrane protein TerC
MDFAALFTAENAIALLTLSALEIVLGIDNIVFISILTGRLPEKERPRARFIGLALAMVMRILLLLAIKWLMGLTAAIFTLPGWLAPIAHDPALSGKDLILLGGGLFLIFKATLEIHHKVDGGESAAGTHPDAARALTRAGFSMILGQIVLVDLVFSLDSVITAVGMAQSIEVMIAAVIIAVIVMMALAGPISNYIERHPTLKMLALAFLILIGFNLSGEALGWHIPKGYVYFAMAFSLGVEMLNIRVTRKSRKTPPPPAPAA